MRPSVSKYIRAFGIVAGIVFVAGALIAAIALTAPYSAAVVLLGLFGALVHVVAGMLDD